MSTTNHNRWISAGPMKDAGEGKTWLRLIDIERIDVEPTQGGGSTWRVLFTIKGTQYLYTSDFEKGKAEDSAFKLMRLVEDAHAKNGGAAQAPHREAQPSLGDMLRRMRLHSLGLVFFGGPVLHSAVGTPTQRETHETALNQFAEWLPDEHRAEIIQSLTSAPIWDLNKVAPLDAAITVARSINNATCKV